MTDVARPLLRKSAGLHGAVGLVAHTLTGQTRVSGLDVPLEGHAAVGRVVQPPHGHRDRHRLEGTPPSQGK